MKLAGLALLYFLVGFGASAVVLARARADPTRRLLDASLMLGFWPLYGPFLWLEAPRPNGEPLDGILSSADVAARLEEAERKLAALDTLLARPQHAEDVALARQAALIQAGDFQGAALAKGRVTAIRRLTELRGKLHREVEHVRELTLQLRLHGELVRLSGENGAETHALVVELKTRVELLDALVEHGVESAVS